MSEPKYKLRYNDLMAFKRHPSVPNAVQWTSKFYSQKPLSLTAEEVLAIYERYEKCGLTRMEYMDIVDEDGQFVSYPDLKKQTETIVHSRAEQDIPTKAFYVISHTIGRSTSYVVRAKLIPLLEGRRTHKFSEFITSRHKEQGLLFDTLGQANECVESLNKAITQGQLSVHMFLAPQRNPAPSSSSDKLLSGILDLVETAAKEKAAS